MNQFACGVLHCCVILIGTVILHALALQHLDNQFRWHESVSHRLATHQQSISDLRCCCCMQHQSVVQRHNTHFVDATLFRMLTMLLVKVRHINSLMSMFSRGLVQLSSTESSVEGRIILRSPTSPQLFALRFRAISVMGRVLCNLHQHACFQS